MNYNQHAVFLSVVSVFMTLNAMDLLTTFQLITFHSGTEASPLPALILEKYGREFFFQFKMYATYALSGAMAALYIGTAQKELTIRFAVALTAFMAYPVVYNGSQLLFIYLRGF